MKQRNQTGRIYERCGSFYVQYRTTKIVDGQTKRVQLSEFLAEKSDKYYSKKSKGKTWHSQPLVLKRDEVMLRVNREAQQPRTGVPAQPKDMKIVDFYEQKYLPFLESSVVSDSKSAATLAGYKKYWDYYLKDHFADSTLLQYSAGQGTNFLTELASKLSKSTLSHIRALGSSIFKHAIATEALGKNALTINPWRNVQSLVKPKEKQTAHYTLQEIQDIINALGNCTVEHKQKQPTLHEAEKHEHLEAQLLMGLTFFCGLRPSEAIGLNWTDIQDGYIHLQRSVVYGIVREQTKTQNPAAEQIARIPLINPALFLLMAWHDRCNRPTAGWVFSGTQAGRPLNIPNLVNRVIRPCLKEAGLTWKGLYAGRRGVGTMLVDLTNGLVAAQELLRHKNMSTTAKFYKKQTQNALDSGMKLLQAAVVKGNGTGKCENENKEHSESTPLATAP